MLTHIVAVASLSCSISMNTLGAEPLMSLDSDDHIAVIGNALADRMQHAGYLETFIQAGHKDERVTVRHLGFAGDELDVRLRSQGFGSPDEWLTRAEADFVWAFFGYNESFDGEAGLNAFRTQLTDFIKKTRAQKYNGEDAPEIVLFSPIAAEDHPDPNFPDPSSLNPQLRMYTDAMREVANAHDVAFVDMFTMSQKAYELAEGPLTINSVHLTDDGYAALAPMMYKALFDDHAPSLRRQPFEDLRMAVCQKNAMHFSRYRTVDGYNVYGGRSYLKFDGITNRDTMQREMEIRDVMTANLDKEIWRIAHGGKVVVVPEELPAPVIVETNKPGENPDGTHKFLSGEDAIAKMEVPEGLEITLFASEEEFPLLGNPVQMAFDTKGRLWVAAWPNYPERTPESTEGDSLLIFEDVDGDGRADTCTPFIDDLNAPTGFQFYDDGVILVQAPDVWFLRDTDGDDRADWKQRVLNGLDSADSHHTANSLCIDPGGSIYLSDGVFHRTQIETPWGAPVRNSDGAIYRFEPRTGKVDRYIAYGFANPHGRVFDAWGNDFVTDATGNHTYFGPGFSGHIDYPHKHRGYRQFWDRPSRPCPGTGILSTRHFPAEYQDNFLNINVIGFQGIFRVDVREEGAGLWGTTLEPHLVKSSDPNFRPIALDVAPDGSLYFLDWHNPIIGHMQHHIRDPNRDHVHGRIYRVTHKDRPLLKEASIAGESIEHLLDLLKTPENNVRTRAKLELGARDTTEVLAAVDTWVKQFNRNSIDDQHHIMEALWVYQWHNVVNETLLRQLLMSPEPRARAAAAHVLCYWRDRVSGSLAIFRQLADDPSARVRLEAVRAASFYKGPEAMEVAHAVLRHEMDYYLNYVFDETTRQLQMHMKGKYYPEDDDILAALAPRLSIQELLDAPDREPIFVERLMRPGLSVNTRTASLYALLELHKTDPITEGIAILGAMDESDRSVAAEDLGYVIAAHPAPGLAASRDAFLSMATSGRKDNVRRAAFASVICGDGKAEKVISGTRGDSKAQTLMIQSLAIIANPIIRADFETYLYDAIASDETSSSVRGAALRALPLLDAESASPSFDILARHLADGRDVHAAAEAVLQLQRQAWSQEGAKAAAEGIVAWCTDVPADKRTNERFSHVVQAGMELATTLSDDDASRIQKSLLDLGVNVVALKSVREQMRFDVTRIVVQAGKQIEIRFENMDMMPHNLIVVQPGSREKIGRVADEMDAFPDKNGRTYVPDDKRIIAASKMIEPGMKTTLKFKAPDTPGNYEYVCTYPEHWMSMWGTLVVVDDIEAYLNSSNGAGE